MRKSHINSEFHVQSLTRSFTYVFNCVTISCAAGFLMVFRNSLNGSTTWGDLSFSPKRRLRELTLPHFSKFPLTYVLLYSSPDPIRYVYHFQFPVCDTESDPRWSWFGTETSVQARQFHSALVNTVCIPLFHRLPSGKGMAPGEKRRGEPLLNSFPRLHVSVVCACMCMNNQRTTSPL